MIGQYLEVHEDKIQNVCNYYQEMNLYISSKWVEWATILKDWDWRVVRRHVTSEKEGRQEAFSDITVKFKLNVSEDMLTKMEAGMGNKQAETGLNDVWTQLDQGWVQELLLLTWSQHWVRHIPTRPGTSPGPFSIELVNVRLTPMVAQLDQSSNWNQADCPGIY